MRTEPGRGVPMWVEAPSAVALALMSLLEGFRSAGGTLTDPAPWVGVIASFYALGRYRLPRSVAALALVSVALGCVLPLLVTLYHFASRNRLREVWVCLAIAVAAGLPWLILALVRNQSLLEGRVATWTGFGNPVLAGLALALGMWAGSRRRLMEALKDQVEQLRVERELRAEQARSAERARIAREMHDVLAHRLSLLMLHTGVLQVQAETLPDATSARIALLRGTTRQALDDLREVLGALRSDEPGETAGATGVGTPGGAGRGSAVPAPALQDLAELLAEARAAGQQIDSEISGDVASASTSHRLAVHRLVREALTNARKHAHATPVGVRVHYGPPATTVEVVNGPAGDTDEFRVTDVTDVNEANEANEATETKETAQAMEATKAAEAMKTTKVPQLTALTPPAARTAAKASAEVTGGVTAGVTGPACVTGPSGPGDSAASPQSAVSGNGVPAYATPRDSAPAPAEASPLEAPVPTDSALPGGYGLIGLAERVSALGGHLYTGATGGGWRLSARLPVSSADLTRPSLS
ncbi:histidine kinase [Streptomyces sp. NPDC002018]|uniref:histidine kinase n=1 Tax=Streptomyces sp. NPDC002018 TaxID=3364629 RepID=UPI0036CEAD6D